MKLSEAIRLGSMLGPQLFHQLVGISGDEVGPQYGSCALGAALAAAGVNFRSCSIFSRHWPWVSTLHGVECPVCNGHLPDVNAIIIHLNDHHRWSREAIADFIATIEPEEIPASCPEPVVAAELEVPCSA